ncbi:MAG: leucine-rich repeat protein [Clostridia bacterium]|nr:leucine-rich repeat protein [Clostridia bacterium]
MKKRFRTVLSFVSALCIMLCAVSAAAVTQTVASGECGRQGDNITWKLDSSGTLTVGGAGEMGNYANIEDVPWASVREQVRSVVITDGVTVIGKNAFNGCGELTDAAIPGSVTDIKTGAFSACSHLKSVYFGGTAEQWKDIGTDVRGNEALRFWADVYYDGNRETPGRDTRKIPRIALTYVPAYGDRNNFEGIVYTEDGTEFDRGAYRVTLYVGGTWPKPTFDEPSVPLDEKGHFSLYYFSGGTGDLQSKFLDLMLIPADFDQKNADYEQTKNAAIDYVEVYRTEDGKVTVLPDRRASETADTASDAIPSGLLPVAGDKIAVNVGFYTDGSSPGSALSEDLIRRQLTAVSDFSDVVRFYGAAGELAKAYEIAHDMGFTVLGNAWLSNDKTANQAELDALIRHCNNGLCRVAIVGSEVLLRKDLSTEELISAIGYVRERIKDKSIPVTTADSVDILLSRSSVRDACDLLMPNCYPFWSGSPIDQAKERFEKDMNALEAIKNGKEIVVSETGWPTAGESEITNAKAGEAEAAQYYAAIREWSLSTNTQVLFFDAADEPWKAADEGTVGAHWGFLTSDFKLKPCFAELDPFRTMTTVIYVSGDVDGDGRILAEDARLALRTSAKLESLSEIQILAADVDGDGQILAGDARQILRYSAKLQNEFVKAA